MAVELKSRGVTSVSLWPGAVQTELVSQYILEDKTPEGTDFKVNLPAGEIRLHSSSLVFVGFFRLLLSSGFSFHQMKDVFSNGETTELSGKCIVSLAEGGIKHTVVTNTGPLHMFLSCSLQTKPCFTPLP